LAAYDRSPRTWELPRLWQAGLATMDWKGKHLVDLGSEISPWPWWIAKQGAKVTLVELRRDWVSLWERLRRELDVQVEWVFTESDVIPLPSGCADVVSSVSVIEHQRDKAQAMAELERVLRPGGTLALSCDIFEPGLGMAYPEWNGRALGAAEFDDRLGAHPALAGRVPAAAWNWADVRPFLKWFRRTAPHHNYAMAAAVLHKQEAAPKPSVPTVSPSVLIAQPDDAAGAWAAAPWLSAWARQESARPFFWIVPAAEEARLLALLPHATRHACNTEIAPRLAARTLRAAAPAGLHLLVAPFSAATPWSQETHRLVLWWRDFLGELRAALALLPDGEPTWSAAFTITASQAPDCRYAPLPPDAAALLRHATEAAGLPLPAAENAAPMPALSVAAALAARFVAAGAPAAPDRFASLAQEPTILLIPEGFSPRWPQHCWEALAQQLQARGTPVRLLDASGCAALALADLRAAAGVVCAEGPFAPMAATCGVPVVVVAGGAEPERWIPDAATAKLVQGLPACRGCGRTCLLAHPVCVEAIPVEAVAAALHALRTTGDRTPLTVPVPLPDNLTAENLPSIAGRRLRQLAGESQAAERRFGDSVRELEAARHTAAALREENGRLGAQVLQLADDSQHRLEHIHTIETRIAALDRENASRLEHIHLLETRLTDCERDRETRLAHIHEIEQRLAASETDREARLQHIHALEARLLGRPTGDAGTPPSAQP
ncbi:MAG TPA: methyltransferase domain-containing protein, partial [Opitutaceae bacterium]|nr:methyltransferase domain-containing protein [Opitutaceae bacterium]